MDNIREMLDRIQSLSAEELAELESTVLSEFDTAAEQDPTREVVDRMNQLADAADALRGEKTRREAEAAELSRMRDEATARVKGEATAAADVPVDDEEDQQEVDAGTPPTQDEEDKEKEKDAVLAAGEAASVSEPEQAEAANDQPKEAEAAIEFEAETVDTSQPAVQPAAVADNPDLGKTDAEVPTQDQHVADGGDSIPSADPGLTEASTDEAAQKTAELSSSEATAEDGKDPEAPVTAAADGTVEVPKDRQPKASAAATVAITAGADIPGITAGSHLPDMRAVADALIKRKQAMGRTSGGDGEQHTVATLIASFPEDRILSSSDQLGNAAKVEKVVAPAAITAAGGLCAPVEVRYDIFGLGDLGRPVRDSLAVFSADRGGIRFVTPPVLGDLNGAVSTWTVQDDIDAATAGAPDPVKPCIRVNCGSEVTVYTDAIPLCLTFGNMGARAYPELVERHTELGMIWHARYAEQRLLTRIGALSTAVSAARVLGAARDFFVQLEKASAAYRNRHRMANTTPLRVILPDWFRNMLRADLVMQLPGDGQDETFGLADTFLNNWFSVRHINVTWTMDGEAGQIFGTQSAGALLDFPSTVKWYLFAEGTFLFLDGGTLDLGLVRDSTLNGTNDYKIFLETFEGVAKVGIESLAVTSTLKVSGQTAATVVTP